MAIPTIAFLPRLPVEITISKGDLEKLDEGHGVQQSQWFPFDAKYQPL